MGIVDHAGHGLAAEQGGGEEPVGGIERALDQVLARVERRRSWTGTAPRKPSVDRIPVRSLGRALSGCLRQRSRGTRGRDHAHLEGPGEIDRCRRGASSRNPRRGLRRGRRAFRGRLRADLFDVVRIRAERQAKYRMLREHFAGRPGPPSSSCPPSCSRRPSAASDDLAARIAELNRGPRGEHGRRPAHVEGESAPGTNIVARATADRGQAHAAEESAPHAEARGSRRRSASSATTTTTLKGPPGPPMSSGSSTRRCTTCLLRETRPVGCRRAGASMDKSPEYGARVAQQAAFAEGSALRGARLRARVQTANNGMVFKPDADQFHPGPVTRVLRVQGPDGGRLRRDVQVASRPRARLVDTMKRRAEAAQSLGAKCRGWTTTRASPR